MVSPILQSYPQKRIFRVAWASIDQKLHRYQAICEVITLPRLSKSYAACVTWIEVDNNTKWTNCWLKKADWWSNVYYCGKKKQWIEKNTTSQEKILMPVNKIKAFTPICIALAVFFCNTSFYTNSCVKTWKKMLKKLMCLWKTSAARKIQKLKRNSNAVLNITIIFLSEKQQKWVPTLHI